MYSRKLKANVHRLYSFCLFTFIHRNLFKMVDPVAGSVGKRLKRQRTANQPTAGPSKSSSSSSARLFAPFRALGYVTNHIPFSMFMHSPKGALAKPTVNIVTSVGKSWMMWDAAKMTLVFVGKECKEEIKSLVVTGTEVFAVAGNKIYSYVRGKEVSVQVTLHERHSQ